MYAVNGIGKLAPGKREELLKLGDSARERLKGQKGFISAVRYSDEESNEYGNFTLWETKEDFDAYFNSLPSEMYERAMSLFAERPGRKIYYVDNYITSD